MITPIPSKGGVWAASMNILLRPPGAYIINSTG